MVIPVSHFVEPGSRVLRLVSEVEVAKRVGGRNEGRGFEDMVLLWVGIEAGEEGKLRRQSFRGKLRV